MRRLWILPAALLVACQNLMHDPLEQLRTQNARAGGGLPEVVSGRVQWLQARNPTTRSPMTS